MNACLYMCSLPGHWIPRMEVVGVISVVDDTLVESPQHVEVSGDVEPVTKNLNISGTNILSINPLMLIIIMIIITIIIIIIIIIGIANHLNKYSLKCFCIE